MNVAFQALAQNAASKLAVAELALFKAGQVLQALVVAQTSAGLAQLKIGDVLVEAQLPQSVPLGTTLQLQVKTGGSAPQLVLVGQHAAAAATTTPVAAQQPLPAPVANVVLPEAQTPAPLLPVQPSPPQVSSRPQTQTQPQIEPQPQTAMLRPSIVPQGQPVATPASQIESGVPAPIVAQQAGTPSAAATPATLQPHGEPVATPAMPAPVVVTGQAAPAAVVPQAPSPQLASAVAVRPEVPGQPQVIVAQPLPVVPAPAVEPAVAQQTAPQVAVLPLPTPGAPEPMAASPLLVAQAAPKVQQTVADLPKVTPAPVQAASPVPQSLPPTPEQAVAQMVPEAMGRQNSVAPLLQTLAAVVAQPGLLPEPVMRAALQVLAQRLVMPDGKVEAADIEAAAARSGVFLEAKLAARVPVAGDAKAALVNLKAVLEKVLGGVPPANPPQSREAPPLKGQPPRAMAMEAAPLPDGPRDVVRALHSQTDAAISRVKLGQLAALPDAPGTPRPAQPELRIELPFLIGHELVMAQLQIAPDGRRHGTSRKRGWTMRFAMNFSQTGEVGAEVGLLGKSVNVALWAAEPETAAALNAALPELAAALEALGLDPGPVRIRSGVPEPVKIASGHFVDALT